MKYDVFRQNAEFFYESSWSTLTDQWEMKDGYKGNIVKNLKTLTAREVTARMHSWTILLILGYADSIYFITPNLHALE